MIFQIIEKMSYNKIIYMLVRGFLILNAFKITQKVNYTLLLNLKNNVNDAENKDLNN